MKIMEVSVKDNKDIFNEAFFKKQSYKDKIEKKFPQYSPIKDGNREFGENPVFAVTNTDEVKKRLDNTLGVAFGNNNIRSMASRAVKQFPIIISDNVEPETAIMLKRLMEEQYAEYINLLISNQVVNLADFTAGSEKGNIAIQAIDAISGADISNNSIAHNLAKTGTMDADTIFSTMPLYSLIRENKDLYSVNDEIVDSLLESAVIVPTENEKALVNFLLEDEDFVKLFTRRWDPNEEKIVIADRDNDSYPVEVDQKLGIPVPTNPLPRNRVENPSNPLGIVGPNARVKDNNQFHINDSINKNDEIKIMKNLNDNGKKVYKELKSADIVLNTDALNDALNKNVSTMLSQPENAEILRRFEKATFLLQTRRIAGIEYYNYLTLRLGMPISDDVRLRLIKDYKIGDVVHYDQEGNLGKITEKDARAIKENRVKTSNIVKLIGQENMGKALKQSAVAGGVGAGAGLAGAIALATISGPFALILAPLMGATVGGSFLFNKLKKQRKEALRRNRSEGWERVERLIDQMDDAQQSVVNKPLLKKREFDYLKTHEDELSLKNITGAETNDLFNKLNTSTFSNDDYTVYDKTGTSVEDKTILGNSEADYMALLDANRKMVSISLKESLETLTESTYEPKYNKMFELFLSESVQSNLEDDIIKICEECQNDKELIAQLLSEKTIMTTSVPMQIKYVDKKPDMDAMVTPAFMARSELAYGNTEIDRRDMKGRKYNQPLIMTIRFKERFADDKYSDNELTAVIGILGKIIRIPSEEMKYVLAQNAKGNTVDGIFGSSVGLKNAVSDLMSVSRISKDVKNLPQSADIWHNLEKVATLAAANKISGKRTGNLANAHIVFSQKEIDDVRNDFGIDYLKDTKKALSLMKRYSAFTLMIANDAGQRVYIMDDQDNISWNVVPYSAFADQNSSDSLTAALTKMSRMHI